MKAIGDDIYVRHDVGDYEISMLVGEHGIDTDNDNMDVWVQFKDGSTYVATFYTFRNIHSLFEKSKQTGECANGLYFYATDMIIVERLTKETIIETVYSLISCGELKHAFSRISDSEDSEPQAALAPPPPTV